MNSFICPHCRADRFLNSNKKDIILTSGTVVRYYVCAACGTEVTFSTTEAKPAREQAMVFMLEDIRAQNQILDDLLDVVEEEYDYPLEYPDDDFQDDDGGFDPDIK